MLPHRALCLYLLAGLLAGCHARGAERPRRRAPATSSPVATALRLSLDTLLAQLPADSATACIMVAPTPFVRWLPADAGLLRALTPRRRRVVPGDACPPTYAPGMIALVDSLGRPVPGPTRPPGYVDPYFLRVLPPEQRGDTIRLRIDVGQGYGGRHFRCAVVGAGASVATCATEAWFVH